MSRSCSTMHTLHALNKHCLLSIEGSIMPETLNETFLENEAQKPWEHHEKPLCSIYMSNRIGNTIGSDRQTHTLRQNGPSKACMPGLNAQKYHLFQTLSLFYIHSLRACSLHKLVLIYKCNSFDNIVLSINPPKNITCSIIIELGILYQPLHHFKMIITERP